MPFDLGTPFSQFPAGPKYSGKFYDFHSDEEITEGVATAINSGTNTVIDTAAHGAMRLSGAATTDDSGSEWQVDAAGIICASQKELLYVSRHVISDVTQSDFRAGIGTIDTSWMASSPSNGIWFRSDDGDALLDLVVNVGGVESLLAGVATLADATWVRLAMRCWMTGEATGFAYFWVNEVQVGVMPVTIASTSLMTAGVAFQSGNDTGTKTCDTDYLGWRLER